MAAKPEHAQRADKVQDVLFRPFIRRQTFLYTGLTDRPNLYCLGTLADRMGAAAKDDFETRDANQAVALVELREPTLAAAVADWWAEFSAGHQLDGDLVGALDLLITSALLAKVKWDPTQPLGIDRDFTGRLLGPVTLDPKGKEKRAVVYRPVTHYYFYETIRSMLAAPLAAVFDGTQPVCRIAATASPTSNILEITASEAEIQETLGHYHPGGLRLPVTKGIDLLSVKHLVERKKEPDTPDFHGLAVWSAGGGGLSYGHVYESPTLRLFAYRPYSRLFPRPSAFPESAAS